MAVETQICEKDVHGHYTSYLFSRGHSLHSLMNTVHKIVVNEQTKTAVVKRRGCCEVPTKLMKHMKWYLTKNYKTEKIQIL